MRRSLIAAAAACALVVLAPASALAHGQRGHHRRGHARHFKMFGDQGTGAQSSSAGTVQSFTGGVLTIALTNGSTVSGTVTDGTRLICPAAEPAGQQGSGWQSHDGSGGDNGGAGNGGDDQGQGDDDQAQSCSTTNLTSGAVVQAAELSLSGAGAVWKAVVLAPPASSTTSPTAS